MTDFTEIPALGLTSGICEGSINVRNSSAIYPRGQGAPLSRHVPPGV